MGDDSDHLIKSFHTRQEAEAYIRHRNEEHPHDELYEHWYVKCRGAVERRNIWGV